MVMNDQWKQMERQLKEELEKKRYQHTVGVAYTASCLAMRYDADLSKAMLAGLLHDCAKCLPGQKQVHLCRKHHIAIRDVELVNPSLLHAKLGAFLAKTKYGVDDVEILHAIEVHTTGSPGMNLLDKIVFVADYIEPNREKAFGLPEIRRLAFADMDQAVVRILHDTMHYLNQKKGAIDPKTQETYQYYIEQWNRREEKEKKDEFA